MLKLGLGKKNNTWLEFGKLTVLKYQFLSPQTQLEIFRLPFEISSVSLMLTDVKMLLYHIENIQWLLPNVQTQT